MATITVQIADTTEAASGAGGGKTRGAAGE